MVYSSISFNTLKEFARSRPKILRSLSNDVQQVEIKINQLSKLLLLQGTVMNGYGRGSKKLGVPTANLPQFDQEFKRANYTTGVYFGWGRVLSGSIHGAIVNVGKSPTFVGQENPINIVEAHLLDYSGEDFYGDQFRLGLLAFVRPEIKFGSFDALVAQINDDIQVAKLLNNMTVDNVHNVDIKSKNFAVGRDTIYRFLSYSDSNTESLKSAFNMMNAKSECQSNEFDTTPALWGEV